MNIDSDSFGRIIDSLNDGLYFVDPDRKILYWNKAAERISGYTAEEVVGKSCYDNILTHVDANDTYGHDIGDEVLKFIANTFVNDNDTIESLESVIAIGIY